VAAVAAGAGNLFKIAAASIQFRFFFAFFSEATLGDRLQTLSLMDLRRFWLQNFFSLRGQNLSLRQVELSPKCRFDVLSPFLSFDMELTFLPLFFKKHSFG